jgi:starch synthase (maltosyl-transferring)
VVQPPPDGTLKYAENPPKRYQDIYNVNWDTEDWQGLWEALLEIVRFWVDHGVRVFRVDNPHTKPTPFWEWLIREDHRHRPRRPVPRRGVHPPRAARRPGQGRLHAELHVLHVEEHALGARAVHRRAAHAGAARGRAAEPLRQHPDILHEYLQHGGPPAFATRLVLAATLSPTYGIYSGYESFENVPVKPGSEEYLDSEKYEAKERTLDGPLLPMVQSVNAIRRANPALQVFDNITFLETENDGLIAYVKQARGNSVICVVNLDPHNAQEGMVHVPDHLGLPFAFVAHDLLTDARFGWHVGGNYVRLEPPFKQAHILRIEGPR